MASQPPFTEHHIERDHGRLYARDYAGAGPAFVLLHGFPDNLHIYDALIPHLVAAGRRVVAFDFLGFGASDKPPGAVYSFAQQRDDLAAVVDALGLDRVVPVGHDAGGPAAINYALDHPDRVAGLCILNSFYADAPAQLPELIALFATPALRALTSAILQSPAQFGWLLGFQQQQFMAALPDHLRAGFQSVLQPIITENFTQQPSAAVAFSQMTLQIVEAVTYNAGRMAQLKTLDVPVKIIWGSADPYLDSSLAEHLQAQFQHANLRVLPAGHWLQIDIPDQVAQEMLA